jgi:hypothetical protein
VNHPTTGGRRRRAVQVRALAIGLLTFAGLGAAAHAAWRAWGEDQPRMEIAEDVPPAVGDAYYLAHDKGGHVDHHVLYHGTDPQSVENLRMSDVLLLGNSRLLFAFSRQSLRSFFPRHGLTYFMLAFGHRESDAFPRAIIERFDLRPRLVIVNADRFFGGPTSAFARSVMAASRFDAWKLWFEAEVTHLARRRIHRWIPHLPDLRAGERELIAYRSRRDGTWLVATRFSGLGAPFPPEPPQDLPVDARRLEAARTFKDDVEARGGRLVLCLVPSPRASRNDAVALARDLGVPLVAPHPNGLAAFDGSHLTRESADRFADAFFAELEPIVVELGLSRPQP